MSVPHAPSPQVYFIDFGACVLDPTPHECEEEVQQLRYIFGVYDGPASGRCRCRVSLVPI